MGCSTSALSDLTVTLNRVAQRFTPTAQGEQGQAE